MGGNSGTASALATASGDVSLVPEPTELASGDVPEAELDIALALAYPCPGVRVPNTLACDIEGGGWLSVQSARFALVTRALLRVYAMAPLFWHRRIAWAKRGETLAAARLELADGKLQLQ